MLVHPHLGFATGTVQIKGLSWGDFTIRYIDFFGATGTFYLHADISKRWARSGPLLLKFNLPAGFFCITVIHG